MDWIDPDKVIAAILTGLAVKVGEKGYAYLKNAWNARRSQKNLQCGSIEAQTCVTPFLKKTCFSH